MQFAIELPDKLGQKILQHANIQQFVQRAFEKELSAENNNTSGDLNEDIPPITRSLVGLLARSNFNEMDYKQHLEDKYL